MSSAPAVSLLLLLLASSPQVEVLPPGASPADRLPLVVAIHGRGGDAATFARRVKRMKLGARVVALQARIAALAREKPTCGAPVLFGFSQGGALVMAVAAASSAAEVAGVVELAGALPEGYPLAAAGDAPPVWGAHGTADEIVPVDMARRTFARAAEGGRRWTLKESDTGHDLSREIFSEAAEALRRNIAATCPK